MARRKWVHASRSRLPARFTSPGTEQNGFSDGPPLASRSRLLVRKARDIYTGAMKICFVAAFFVGSLAAQEIASPPPSEPVDAPVVHPDGRVTFQLRAPQASSVAVAFVDPAALRNRPQAMTKAADGRWSLTTAPLAQGIYGYGFVVNGVAMADPADQETVVGRNFHMSVLEVPGSATKLYERQGAPRGSLSIRTYWSRELKIERRLLVYLPPEYDSDTRRKFPVVYLRHGVGGMGDEWIGVGRVDTMLENLLAVKKAVPMILVMPNGYPSIMGSGSTLEGIERTSRELVHDIVPLIESNYRVMTGPENRALAGLSMGGGQALVGGLKNLDTFAWIATFSSRRDLKSDLPGFLENPALANKKLKLLFLSCGTEDPRHAGNLEMAKALKQSGIRYEFFSTPGDHEWSVWRESLSELLPKLFRPKQAATGRIP